MAKGRKSILNADKRADLVAALKGVKGAEGFEAPSRYILNVLADAELVRFETVKTGGRGRPALAALVTRKGQSYINFAK